MEHTFIKKESQLFSFKWVVDFSGTVGHTDSQSIMETLGLFQLNPGSSADMVKGNPDK